MNCERYQDKLIAALASGEKSLDLDVAAHLRACAECGKFYEAQVQLFQAIDSGLRAVVNERMPASLLPGVRAQIAAKRMAGSWFLTLVPVAGIVMVALLILVGVVLTWVRARTGTVTASFFVHLGYNGLQLAGYLIYIISGSHH